MERNRGFRGMSKIVFNSMPKVERYLRLKGIPKDYIYAMRNALISDAITQADGFTVARFYTAFGLALYEQYGYTEEQLVPIYQQVSEIMQSVGNDETTWHEQMEKLRDLAGIIINVDPDFSEIELPEEGDT